MVEIKTVDKKEPDKIKTFPKEYHVRYGIFLTNYKQNRWIIARDDVTDYPLVFLSSKMEENGYPYDSYDLYSMALTADDADEILELLKNNETVKARRLFQKTANLDSVFIEDVGPIVLDDYIPDEWYDSWKVMEHIILGGWNFTGYFDDVVEVEEV